MGSGFAIAVADTVAAGLQAKASFDLAEEWKQIYDEAAAREFAIADRMQDRAEEQAAFWRNNFRGCEVNFVQEVCAREPKRVHEDAVRFRVAAELRRTHDTTVRDALRCVPLGCAGSADLVRREASLAASRTGAAAMLAASRHERNRIRLLNAQDEATLRGLLSVGHKAYHSSSASVSAAAAIYEANAASAAASTNSALEAAGASVRALSTSLRTLAKTPMGDGDPKDPSDMGPNMPQEVADARAKEARDAINDTADQQQQQNPYGAADTSTEAVMQIRGDSTGTIDGILNGL